MHLALKDYLFLVKFIWINMSDTPNFAIMLQNHLFDDAVLGVESFKDGEPLTLQKQVG